VCADKTPAAITVATVLRIFAVFQQGAVVVPEDELRGVGSLLIGKQTRKHCEFTRWDCSIKQLTPLDFASLAKLPVR